MKRLANPDTHFAFMLCRTLGAGRWLHPDQMLAEMSHGWFEDWRAHYNADPWGERRDDLRMMRIVWAIFQKGVRKTLDESKFGFRFGPAKPPPSPTEYRDKAMRVFGLQAAMFDRKKRA